MTKNLKWLITFALGIFIVAILFVSIEYFAFKKNTSNTEPHSTRAIPISKWK